VQPRLIAHVTQLNGRYLRRCLITDDQLADMRKLFHRRAQVSGLKLTTAQVDDALWVLLETGVLLPPFDVEINNSDGHGDQCARLQPRMVQ
jgi:hypothetical protein